eukprot:6663308-Pyramimonas_sp.AAC.1
MQLWALPLYAPLSVELPLGPQRVCGVYQNGCGGRMRALASGPSVELPYGATDRVRGVPDRV